jgi:hypothetical protein
MTLRIMPEILAVQESLLYGTQNSKTPDFKSKPLDYIPSHRNKDNTFMLCVVRSDFRTPQPVQEPSQR